MARSIPVGMARPTLASSSPSPMPLITPSNSLPQSSPSPPGPYLAMRFEDLMVDRTACLSDNRRDERVFRATWNGDAVVVKLMPKETLINDFLDAIHSWKDIQHLNVLRLFGTSLEDADPLFVVHPYCSKGNIKNYLRKHPMLDRAAIVFDIALGMRYLHNREILHGSLRPTNILIGEDGQASIADYGMIMIKPSDYAGAYRYFSPEAWKGSLSRPSDVFAFAMTAYEIFTGFPPWRTLSEDQVYQLVVREDERPDRPEEELAGLNDQIWGIIEEAWHKESRLRPQFEHIIALWQRPPLPDDYLQPCPRPGSPGELLQLGTRNVDTDAQSNLSSESSPPAYYRESSVSFRQSIAPRHTSHRLHSGTAPTAQYPESLPPNFTPSSGSATLTSSSSLFSMESSSLSKRVVPGLTSVEQIPNPLMFPQNSISRNPSVVRNLTLGRSFTPGAALQPSYPFRIPSISESEEIYVPFNDAPLDSANSNSLQSYEGDMLGYSSYSASAQGATGIRRQLERDPISVASSTSDSRSPILLAGALQAEVMEGRNKRVIDSHLLRIIDMASQSEKDTQKLITAGVIPTLIYLLKARAVESTGLEIVLITMGSIAFDSLSANTIYRTKTSSTLVEIFNTSSSTTTVALSVWCLNRICQSSAVSTTLIGQDVGSLLMRKGLKGVTVVSRFCAWCLGSLVCSDGVADILTSQGLAQAAASHLRACVESSTAVVDDISAALYLVARLGRTIKICKALAQAGCVKLVAQQLNTSESPQILFWSARAVGCLMRPSYTEMGKALLDAGCASGLARLPRVLTTDEVEPLESFAFAIQRFSCAEWGGGTRKALVDAGVVDSLLAALRTAADVPYPQVHIELALATSFLGDIGGSAIRKEIVHAGGIEILRRVAESRKAEVAKACKMAITSITGNIWTRNAASAKTAMSHNWNGGCPFYQPKCPFALTDANDGESVIVPFYN